MREHQHEVIQWAKALVQQEPVILDTETTGLGSDAEICQIAIVNHEGRIFMDTLVKPRFPIPPGATRVHGITNAMVESAPTWETVSVGVELLIQKRPVVIYNAAYDLRIMRQSTIIDGLTTDWGAVASFDCAMERYAEYVGEWNEYHGNYRWHKLTDACLQCGIADPENAPAHSALGDCLRTLALLKHMASQ